MNRLYHIYDKIKNITYEFKRISDFKTQMSIFIREYENARITKINEYEYEVYYEL